MGSLSLIIVLIIVVWVIVLAPMVMGNNKPIRRSGEGYDETRVLHAGGTAPVSGRRRPRLTPADVHRFGDDGDYEVVEAVDASAAEDDSVLAEDAGGSTAVSLRGFFTRRDARASEKGTSDDHGSTIDGEVVEPESEAGTGADEATTADGHAPEEASGSTAYSVLTAERDGEGADAGAADGASEPYTLDETYVSPSDYGYRDLDEGRGVTVLREEDSVDAVHAVDASSTPAGEGNEPALSGSTAAVADGGAVTAADTELTDEEIEFARSRSHRGGWDPEREKASKADRFQRRQRTLLGLIVADVVTFVAAFVAGGWVWVLPVAAIVLTAWFMAALRRVVQKERALQAHRVRQLRRARMGVISQESGAAATRFRRRPGAVIVEMDDESPDFEQLPVYRGEPVVEEPRRGREFRPVPRRDDFRATARAS
ncbi:gephyrin-like molybdotransferase receptor GlpR [Corynebacterium sp. UBA2622]|uniref:divisome protein SepX/GlpR n=1 Tax=Corynebacterium sp. UBA2622 TaxID=1946393 RepID=UPI0025BA1D27|nr:gephyrin-like molybdotransferase receptor GlpR [Corynebacterium sp. UBA2622]